MLTRILNNIRRKDVASSISVNNPQRYWTEHNVTLHHVFSTVDESLQYFHWRNDQYFNYIELMPVAGFDEKIILDYGCGPGHDLIGFGTYSRPQYLAGVDISSTSIAESQVRLQLHEIKADITLINENDTVLQFDDNTFDHIHCSGVLHHTPDPVPILKEFKRVLKPGGTINIMVYHYNSLWLHLYVAYQRAIIEQLFPEQDIREQFRHSTDGENCPISRCYLPEEWISLCNEAGLIADFKGTAISMFELSLLDKRFSAIMDKRLRAESRQFLKSLVFDKYAMPKYGDVYAGIDGCYHLKKQ